MWKLTAICRKSQSRIRRILRFGGPSSPTEFSRLDRRAIASSVTKSGVQGRECFAHLLLLEKFALSKQKVTSWSTSHGISPESGWTCYVNLAATRFCMWFDTIDRQNPWWLVPPLDVLMIWHALMQEPRKWDEFVEISECPVSGWDWKLLLPVLTNSDGASFHLPRESQVWAKLLYATPNTDLTQIMDMCIPFMQSRSPDASTEHLASRFMHKPSTMEVSAPAGCSFYLSVEIHSLVERQLDFAAHMLRYSWHHLPTDPGPEMQQMTKSIKRYARFITLIRHGADISSLEAFSDGLRARLVPTPDIELVWRTHRLSPARYRGYCDNEGDWVYNLCGINARHVPNDRDLQASSQVYEHIFREKYQRCHCWYCMADHVSPHFLCSMEQALKEKLSAESKRRLKLRLDIPLDLAQLQCRKCGLHPRRACMARDDLRNSSLRQETTPPGASGSRTTTSITEIQKAPTVRGMPITHMVPTRWAEPAPVTPLTSPLPSGPLEDGLAPNHTRIPPPRHQYRSLSGGGGMPPPTPEGSLKGEEGALAERNKRLSAKSIGKQPVECRATFHRRCISASDDDNTPDEASCSDGRRVDKIGARPWDNNDFATTTTTPITHSHHPPYESSSPGPLREAGDAAWWCFSGTVPMPGMPNSARPVARGIYCDNPHSRSTNAANGEGPSSLHPCIRSILDE